MTRLILFAPRGVPCELDADRPTHTKCGTHASRGKEITEAQAIVYCENSRCVRCDPERERNKRRMDRGGRRKR